MISLIKKGSFLLSLGIFLGISFFFTFCSEEKAAPETKNFESHAWPNHSAEAKYVGSESCTSCHQEIHEDFKHTGKGRAFHKPDPANTIENFDKVHVYDNYSGYHYSAFWSGDEMFIREYRIEKVDTSHLLDVPVHYVIGSGNQTRSYIFEYKGYFYEMPITWYVKKGIWDLSPGYENGANTRFSRPIGAMCMNCHNSDFNFVDNSVNKFLKVGEGIGCEKCHGPGSLHADKMKAGFQLPSGAIDSSIVNPAHLPLELQFDVCRQCHLEGVTVNKANKDFMDFRPGMPLSDFWEVFIPVGDNQADFGFASHVERLQMSQCFINSDGKMNCTTCHDAHKPLADNAISFYNEKCQSCHGIDACGAEHQTLVSADNNCIQCHMPKDGTTDIPHVSTSDHFIRVHDKAKTEESAGSTNSIKNFKNFTTGEENKRDLFLANMDYFEKVDQNTEYLDRVKKYIDFVELKKQIKYYYLKNEAIPSEMIPKLPTDISDPFTAFYVGELLNRAGVPYIPWLERAVRLAPDNLEFATRLGIAYMGNEQLTEAKLAFGRVLQRNDLELKALVNMGYIYQLEGYYPKALELTRRVLQLDPLYLIARENEINILLNLGQIQEAKGLLNGLIKDYPNNVTYKQLANKIATNS